MKEYSVTLNNGYHGKAFIVNMKDRRSVTHTGMIYRGGFAIYVDDIGFLSLDGKRVYIPCGGRCALEAIIRDGLNHQGYSFVYL